jgi:GTPase KRas protein
VRVRDDEISSIPTVLFANKCDMENSRQITTDEGKDMAKKLGSNFFEGSARNNINIEAAFFDMVRAIRLNRNGTRKGGEEAEHNKQKTPVKDSKKRQGSCSLF